MGTFLIILHVVVAVALILTVLLQTGKGAGIGAAFGGGGSGTVFGTRGPASFMSKLTAVAAIVFMLTSLGLNFVGPRTVASDSVMEQVSAPAQEKPAAAPAAPEKPVVTEPEIPKEQAQPIAPAGGDQ